MADQLVVAIPHRPVGRFPAFYVIRALGLTQEQVAEHAGCTPPSVGTMLRGQVVPTPEVVAAVCELTGFHADALFPDAKAHVARTRAFEQRERAAIAEARARVRAAHADGAASEEAAPSLSRRYDELTPTKRTVEQRDTDRGPAYRNA